MRNADQVHERAALGYVRLISAAHGAAEDGVAAHGKPRHGGYPRESAHLMPARQEHGNKPASHIACPACHKDSLIHITYRTFHRMLWIAGFCAAIIFTYAFHSM